MEHIVFDIYSGGTDITDQLESHFQTVDDDEEEEQEYLAESPDQSQSIMAKIPVSPSISEVREELEF